MSDRRSPRLFWATLLALFAVAPAARAAEVPAGLPHYEIGMDLDLANRLVRARMNATWTNPGRVPARELVFNAHSRFVVPPEQIGLMAKTVELLRVQPSEALGETEPPLIIERITAGDPKQPEALPFRFEGDTKTTLVVPLPRPVNPGESVTVTLDFTFVLPKKQGRWGQWQGVTYLSNWLPVFAVYEDCAGPDLPEEDRVEKTYGCWHPVPFVPWHQPFYNEAATYRVRATLPCDQKVACTGHVVSTAEIPETRKQEVVIEAAGVRDFAFLCSARFECYRGRVEKGDCIPEPVEVEVYAFPEHDHYAKVFVQTACEAIATYSKWFGPYPYKRFTIVESFFGWNGNECATLVMIDERVFAMPHMGRAFTEYLVSHEVCHQWWYNLVGTNGYAETWMDEAMACFFSNRFQDQRAGKNNRLIQYPTGLEWLPNIRRDDYRTYGFYGVNGRGDNQAVLQNMEKFGNVVNLFGMAYDKGSRVVAMIEQRMDEPSFFAFIRRVQCKYRYRILRVADFQRELEEFTGQSWDPFFRDWLCGKGLSDWSLEKVEVQKPPCALAKRLLPRCARPAPTEQEVTGLHKVTVWLKQKAEINEHTVLGVRPRGQKGYPIRIPIIPEARSYTTDCPVAHVEVISPCEVKVTLDLDDTPDQIAVDPDRVMLDKNPANNYWHCPVRWRFTPLYTFLDETDLTNWYDRYNVIVGPWMFGTFYDDPWYTRSTMFGVRAGVYKTQAFAGGVYAAYRTDFRDVVAGVDGLIDHWPDGHFQVGFNAERRIDLLMNKGDDTAKRGVIFGRYIFLYNSSLYLPPSHYVEAFATYQENFLPDARKNGRAFGERYDQMATAGVHYKVDYLTPYWDPEGGYKFEVTCEGGGAELNSWQGLGKLSGQFATVKGLPDLTESLSAFPRLQNAAAPALGWLADSRVAVRAYGAVGLPTQGELFTMGGGSLFRGFDLAQRQGSAVWVTSVEWRFPIARRMNYDALDHVMGVRNLYGALFYDVGDAYVQNHQTGPIAHAFGGGLRLDMAWFGFVERSMVRLDIAKAINTDTSVQVWLGIQHPF